MDGLLLLIAVVALVVAMFLWDIKPLEPGHHRMRVFYHGKHRQEYLGEKNARRFDG